MKIRWEIKTGATFQSVLEYLNEKYVTVRGDGL
jgi:hypothetical protein